MGILEKCSKKSLNRGYEYFKNNKIISYTNINEYEYTGKVSGSNNNIYNTKININHIKSCSCTCPFAKDNSKICKHMVALFFITFPLAAKEYETNRRYELRLLEKFQRDDEKQEKKRKNYITRYVNKLSLDELKEKLINYILRDESIYGFDYNGDEFDNVFDFISYDEYMNNLRQYNDEDVTLKLSTVLEGFERINESNTIYINKITNEIIELYDNDEDFDYIFDDYSFNDDYIRLPSQYELRNYDVMEEFIETFIDEELTKIFYNAIKEKGAFRRFKQLLLKHNLTDDWYQFRHNNLIDKVKDFLIDNAIDYQDDI